MKTLSLSLLLLAAAASAGPGHHPEPPTNATWEALKKLVGKWDGQQSKISYKLMSAGTALVETIDMPGESDMITVYTVDGDGILMTHYCAMGNQPRMRAGAADPKTGEISFKFVDVSNQRKPDEPVMHDLVLKPQGDTLVADWTSKTGEKLEHSVFTSTRVGVKKKKG